MRTRVKWRIYLSSVKQNIVSPSIHSWTDMQTQGRGAFNKKRSFSTLVTFLVSREPQGLLGWRWTRLLYFLTHVGVMRRNVMWSKSGRFNSRLEKTDNQFCRIFFTQEEEEEIIKSSAFGELNNTPSSNCNPWLVLVEEGGCSCFTRSNSFVLFFPRLTNFPVKCLLAGGNSTWIMWGCYNPWLLTGYGIPLLPTISPTDQTIHTYAQLTTAQDWE